MREVASEPEADTARFLSLSDVRIMKRGEYVTREMAGEAITVPVRGQVGDLDAIYTFNEVGAFIWGLLDTATSVSDIAQAVCERFDVSRYQAEADFLEFLRTLQSWGIIEASARED